MVNQNSNGAHRKKERITRGVTFSGDAMVVANQATPMIWYCACGERLDDAFECHACANTAPQERMDCLKKMRMPQLLGIWALPINF